MNANKFRDTVGLGGEQQLLVVDGWNYGFNKVGFTKMLREELGYSLAVAKGITDQVLANPPVEFFVPKADHERISLLSGKLGAIVAIRRQPLESRGNSCQ